MQRRRSGEVDVIAGYTSDGRIAQFDLAVLDDPRHAIPPYDAVLLISPQRDQRRGAAERAPAAGRCDRRDGDARRPICAPRQQRVAQRGGTLAVELKSRRNSAPLTTQRPVPSAQVSAWTLKYLSGSVQTATGVQPAPRASAPNDSTEYL